MFWIGKCTPTDIPTPTVVNQCRHRTVVADSIKSFTHIINIFFKILLVNHFQVAKMHLQSVDDALNLEFGWQ